MNILPDSLFLNSPSLYTVQDNLNSYTFQSVTGSAYLQPVRPASIVGRLVAVSVFRFTSTRALVHASTSTTTLSSGSCA